MKRWNGWGDDTVTVELPPKGKNLLARIIGEGRPQEDAAIEDLLRQVPPSRIPAASMISTRPEDRLAHAHGQSLPDWIRLRYGTLRHFPDGVAFPDRREAVEEILAFAARENLVVIPYGGGTSVVGQLDVPESDRPVLTVSMARLNRPVDFDPQSAMATFECGIQGPEIEAHLRAKGFTLGHFPQSFDYSTLGGWIATRSSGRQSARYGRMDQLFAGGELISPAGKFQCPPFPASAAGPDLRQLLLGAEGRAGFITRATVQISPLPERDDIYGVFFPGWEPAQKAIREMAQQRLPYSMIRLSDPFETRVHLAAAENEREVALLQKYLQLRNVSPPESCMCLIGFTGSARRVRTARREVFAVVHKHDGVAVGRAMGEAWRKNRFRSAYLRNALWEMGYAVETLETAAPWKQVSPLLHTIEQVLQSSLEPMDERVHVFSHLSHVYPTGASIGTTAIFRLALNGRDMHRHWETMKTAASRAIVTGGGTISYQHGIGIDHQPYLAQEKGKIGVDLLTDFSRRFDPDNRMNPTKLIPR
jgi:alkyldihydroxyacetonephosphate synthase